jgi:hypothetical protein
MWRSGEESSVVSERTPLDGIGSRPDSKEAAERRAGSRSFGAKAPASATRSVASGEGMGHLVNCEETVKNAMHWDRKTVAGC